MMDENPYAPPTAPTEGPELPIAGDPLPWEGSGSWTTRAWETLRLLLQAPPEAGQRLAARKVLGPAITFAALVGLPFQWVGQVLAALWTPLEGGGGNAAFLKMLGLPQPPPPSPEQLAMAKGILWVQVALTPLLVALGVTIMGLLAHGGLWMVRGLGSNRGLEVSFRTVLYVSAATAWVGFLGVFGLLLPPPLQAFHLLLSLALGLGVFTFQGIVLAHAHGVAPWRGILGVFLPWVLLGCCMAACLAPMAMMGKAG